METGYQQELTYRRSDGSFSAFGSVDASGSTWYVYLSYLLYIDYMSDDNRSISLKQMDKPVE